MESHEKIKLDRNKGIVVLVSDSNNLNKNNISNNYFIIRHNSVKTLKLNILIVKTLIFLFVVKIQFY